MTPVGTRVGYLRGYRLVFTIAGCRKPGLSAGASQRNRRPDGGG